MMDVCERCGLPFDRSGRTKVYSAALRATMAAAGDPAPPAETHCPRFTGALELHTCGGYSLYDQKPNATELHPQPTPSARVAIPITRDEAGNATTALAKPTGYQMVDLPVPDGIVLGEDGNKPNHAVQIAWPPELRPGDMLHLDSEGLNAAPGGPVQLIGGLRQAVVSGAHDLGDVIKIRMPTSATHCDRIQRHPITCRITWPQAIYLRAHVVRKGKVIATHHQPYMSGVITGAIQPIPKEKLFPKLAAGLAAMRSIAEEPHATRLELPGALIEDGPPQGVVTIGPPARPRHPDPFELSDKDREELGISEMPRGDFAIIRPAEELMPPVSARSPDDPLSEAIHKAALKHLGIHSIMFVDGCNGQNGKPVVLAPESIDHAFDVARRIIGMMSQMPITELSGDLITAAFALLHYEHVEKQGPNYDGE